MERDKGRDKGGGQGEGHWKGQGKEPKTGISQSTLYLVYAKSYNNNKNH